MTVDIREGMKIQRIKSFQEKNEKDIFTMIKSSNDDELYGYRIVSPLKKEFIKLSDENEDEFICVDVKAWEDKNTYIEIIVEEEDRETQIFDNDEKLFWNLIDAINDCNHFNDDYFKEMELRTVHMTKEEYMIKSNNDYSLKYRENIHELYQQVSI